MNSDNNNFDDNNLNNNNRDDNNRDNNNFDDEEKKQPDIIIDTPKEVLLSRIESIIFIAATPVTVRRLASHLGLPGRYVRSLLKELVEHYKNRGIMLSEISGGFQFHTNPDNATVLKELTKIKPLKMSRPALETLAIVAYKQPCTRAEIEDVRRVDCGGTLKFLFEKSLIRVLGRKEEPGRPMIYGTSNKFLEMFHLKSLSDLPSLREYTELWDEHLEMVDETDSSNDTQTKTSEKHGPFAGGEERKDEQIYIKDIFKENNSTDNPEDLNTTAPATDNVETGINLNPDINLKNEEKK